MLNEEYRAPESTPVGVNLTSWSAQILLWGVNWVIGCLVVTLSNACYSLKFAILSVKSVNVLFTLCLFFPSPSNDVLGNFLIVLFSKLWPPWTLNSRLNFCIWKLSNFLISVANYLKLHGCYHFLGYVITLTDSSLLTFRLERKYLLPLVYQNPLGN